MANPTASFFMPIVKIDKTPEGYRLVHGKVSSETLDLDGQIADYDWAKKEAQDWFKIGNVREMHQRSAVGKGIDLQLDDANRTVSLTAKIVDPVAINKLDEGVYTGYSFGAKNVPNNPVRIVKDAQAPHGRIVGGKWIEITLADRPANPDSTISIAKVAGGTLEVSDVLGDFADTDEASVEKIGEAVDEPRIEAGQIPADGTVVEISSEEGKAVTAELTKEAAIEIAEAYGDYEAEVILKRDFSDKQRRRMANAGTAMPDGSFPISTEEDLHNAIRAVGRAKNPAAAKKHIAARAKAMGMSDAIPDDWAQKSVDADLTKDGTDVAVTNTYQGDGATAVDPANNGATEHMDSLTAARKAIRRLIVEEASESDPSDNDFQSLIDALNALNYFQNVETFEYQYATSGDLGAVVQQMASVTDKDARRGLYKAVSAALTKAADTHKTAAVITEPVEVVVAEAGPEVVVSEPTKVAEPDTEKFLTAETIKAVLPDQIKAMIPDLLKEHSEVLKEVLGDVFAAKSIEADVEKLGKRAQPGGPVINPEAVGLRTVEKSHPVNSVVEPGDVPLDALQEMAKYVELAKVEDIPTAQSARRMLARLQEQYGISK